VREELRRRVVHVFARIVRVRCSQEELPRDEGADGPRRVHTPNVVYIGARGSAPVEHDGEDFEPRVPYVAPELFLERARNRRGGGGRDRKERLSAGSYERHTALPGPFGEEVERGAKLPFRAL
jgi:hypothetical protein